MKKWIFALLILLTAGALYGLLLGPSPSWNVLLVSVETLRADHLGCYGYDRQTSPHMDALAKEGILFEQAIAQSCFTAPSMASLASSRYPLSHGVMDWKFSGAACPGPTAGEALRSAGYRTVFFGGHGALHTLSPLQRGFQTFEDAEGRTAEALVHKAIEWLESRGDAPFFMWLHFFEPHGPYTPPSFFRRQFLEASLRKGLEGIPEEEWFSHVGGQFSKETRDAFLISQYDGEIAFVDREVGKLAGWLKGEGLWEKTLFILTADHGENLNEKNLPGLAPYDHRNYLFDTLIRVPLLFAGGPLAETAGQRISDPVQLIDILPTIFDCLDRKAPVNPWQGKSLESLLQGEGAGTPCSFSDSGYQELPHKAVRSRNWKLTLNLLTREYTLYHLASDPAESCPAPEESGELPRLKSLLGAWLKRLPRAKLLANQNLDPAQKAFLKRLGYLRE